MRQENHTEWLWQEIRFGNVQALSQLYSITFNDLYRYGIKILKDKAITLQHIDEVFVDVWIKQKRLPEVENVNGYLFIILKRKIFHHLKELNTQKIFSTGTLEEMPEDSYEELLIASQTKDEMKNRISAALQKLTERQKELIQMRYFEELSFEEISQKAGISLRTIYNTIHNAIIILRSELH